MKSIAYPEGSVCSREARSSYPHLFKKSLDKSLIVTLLFSIPAVGFLVSAHADTGVSASLFSLRGFPAFFPGEFRPSLCCCPISNRPVDKSTRFDRLSTCNQPSEAPAERKRGKERRRAATCPDLVGARYQSRSLELD
ncbi:MAG: hypothetical protein EBV83_09695 [Verrucomicrobia bacterium]|nr:hypothetical protein [Verrucomicrobiota bacterium]